MKNHLLPVHRLPYPTMQKGNSISDWWAVSSLAVGIYTHSHCQPSDAHFWHMACFTSSIFLNCFLQCILYFCNINKLWVRVLFFFQAAYSLNAARIRSSPYLAQWKQGTIQRIIHLKRNCVPRDSPHITRAWGKANPPHKEGGQHLALAMGWPCYV